MGRIVSARAPARSTRSFLECGPSPCRETDDHATLRSRPRSRIAPPGAARARPSRDAAAAALRVTLSWIVLATGLGGVLSVIVAAALTLAVLSKVVHHLVSLSAGVLLATALLDVLPEAFSAKAPPQALFATLLGGLLFFFLAREGRALSPQPSPRRRRPSSSSRLRPGPGRARRLERDPRRQHPQLLRRHHHRRRLPRRHPARHRHRAGDRRARNPAGSRRAGDYIVLLNAGFSRGRALFFNALSGLAAVAGGVIGYFIVGPWQSYFPYLLVVASSSFIYVAVADLIPQLQHRLTLKVTAAQMFWIGSGLAIVVVAISQLR